MMHWTKEELDILNRLYPRCDLTKHDIAKILIERTPSAIAKKASDLNLKKQYTSKIDIEKLKEVELYEI